MKQPQFLPVDEVTTHFGPHVAAAGLVIWHVEALYPYFDVGTKPDEKGRFACTRVDPAWAYGDEEWAFKALAPKLQREVIT